VTQHSSTEPASETVDFDRTDLPSGIEVVSESMEDVRSVALGVWVRIGSRDEDGADVGASHFLEHLLFKGTTRRGAKEIAEALDAVGGDMNAFTSKEYTCFHARVLDQDLGIAGDVLADMIGNATIAEDDVDQERQVVLEEILIHHDTPEDLVHTDFAALLLEDHPLAREILGSAESIGAMPRDRVYDYYDRYYRPGNITVAAAGNVSHDDVVELVGDLVGEIPRSGGDRPERVSPSRYAAGEVTIRHRPTEQAHVVLGVPGLARDDDRRFTLLVLNQLLGGGMSSRLFQEIREQRGLAYSTYSYHTSYGDAGWFGAYAGTSPARVDDLLKVLSGELDRLATTVEAEEVARASGGVRGSVVLSLEDTGSRMTRLGKMICTGAEPLTIDEALRRIDEVDVDAVRDLASTLFEQPRCLAVVGPFREDDAARFAPFVR
jgi:predicted Zn-dependent peptidase